MTGKELLSVADSLVDSVQHLRYHSDMVKVTFPDKQQELDALGLLAGRFSFKSFDDGVTLVPEMALEHLAAEGIRFSVEGRAIYADLIPIIRDSATTETQEPY